MVTMKKKKKKMRKTDRTIPHGENDLHSVQIHAVNKEANRCLKNWKRDIEELRESLFETED